MRARPIRERGALRCRRGRCLKQDFSGFLGIFRIAGDRLMAGRRILLAAGERADCGGAIIGDAPCTQAYLHLDTDGNLTSQVASQTNSKWGESRVGDGRFRMRRRGSASCWIPLSPKGHRS